jgi:hypothetical protein
MDAPTIILPSQFEGRTLSKVAADVVSNSPNGRPSELTCVKFDFSKLSFIRPSGVVFFSNLLWWLHHCGAKVEFSGIGVQSAALSFLDDSLFFEQHCGRKLRDASAPRETTRPLVRIAHAESHAWLESNLVPWLAARLGISQASIYAFKACVSELFNNIQDHTQFDIGSIFVQHFPKKHDVTLALSDFGAGIPYKVREQIPNLTDTEAIMHSVREGFTTKSRPGNKGIGLDYLLQTVVARNGGQVTIYSGSSIVRFDCTRNGIQAIPFATAGFCPGTTIDLSLRTNAIEILPEESEDLQW